MFLKINYCQDSTSGGMFRIFLAGIVFLCLGEAQICSGAKLNELSRNSTFYQKLSSGKAIKYYKNIENRTNLVPLSYDPLVLYKPSIKLMEKYNWSLTSKNDQRIPKSSSSFLEIPLEVPEQYLKKSFKSSRTLYLDYTEEYLDASNINHKDVRHSIVMLQIFIVNKQLNRKWVIYAPFLYIAGQIDLPEKWEPKNMWYLIRRELGLPPNNIGRFSYEPNGSYFKIRLHERIDNYYGMKITVDGSHSLPVDDLGPREDERIFQMRVGAKDDLNYSETIFIDATLSNHQNNLVATSYLSNDYSEIKFEDESNVYLEELTFNFPLLEPPSNFISFVKKISFHKSSRDKLIGKYENNLFEPIFLKPRFIRNMGKGVGRLEVGVSNFPGELKKRVLADGTKITKAGLIVDTRGSLVRKVSIFKKGSLNFRKPPELIIFKNKNYLNREDLLDRLPVPIDHFKILNAHDKKITMPLLNEISPYVFRGNSLVTNLLLFILCFIALILCFVAVRNHKKVLADIVCLVATICGRLHARSNYIACLGLFMFFLGVLISLFKSVGPFNQVYDVNFVFKDIFYTLGGLILALNWKYQCVKIYMGLKPTRLHALGDLFKNYNSSYLTGIFVVLFLCAVSSEFYLPLVETFSSLSISLILVGAYHHFYQKTKYEPEIPTTNT